MIWFPPPPQAGGQETAYCALILRIFVVIGKDKTNKLILSEKLESPSSKRGVRCLSLIATSNGCVIMTCDYYG